MRREPMTDDQLRECIRELRKVAEPAGSMHGWWDYISDAEQVLKGRKSILSRDAMEEDFRKLFPHVFEGDGNAA
jgi:hypothetical protein